MKAVSSVLALAIDALASSTLFLGLIRVTVKNRETRQAHILERLPSIGGKLANSLLAFCVASAAWFVVAAEPAFGCSAANAAHDPNTAVVARATANDFILNIFHSPVSV